MKTPDVVFAPSLVDNKYSTEPATVLQNGNVSFVECQEDNCLIYDSLTYIIQMNDSKFPNLTDYYLSLYQYELINDTVTKSPNGTDVNDENRTTIQFELRAFNSPRAFLDIEGEFFFTYPPLNNSTGFNTEEW